MRILFVNTATDMSIGDVARGYKSALERQGHDIADYSMKNRIAYHRRAVPPEITDQSVLSRQASETILNEAMYHAAELVVIISGLLVHPIALWLLGQANIPVAVVFTESPYDDVQQKQWLAIDHVGGSVDITVFTNDRYSAQVNGWHHLPPSFDPAIHHPAEPDEDTACDVIMVGTGWTERQQFLEAVDWTGIDLRLYGIWPNVNPDSPLFPFYRPAVVSNHHISGIYCSAKVCLNFNRKSDVALTPGPRVYELAACLAFQLSDGREDMEAVFGDSVPIFRTPGELGELVRFYLDRPDERRVCAAKAYNRVEPETFDKRVAQMMATIEDKRHSQSAALTSA